MPAVSGSVGEMLPLRPILLGPNTIQPMIGGNEIATGIPDYWNIQVLHGLDDILPEAVVIGQWVARIVDATVDAAAHVPGLR